MGVLDQMLETQTRIRAKYRIQDDYVLSISMNTLLDCQEDDFKAYRFKKYKRTAIYAAKHEALLQAYPGKLLTVPEIKKLRSKITKTKDVFSVILDKLEKMEVIDYNGKQYATFKEKAEAAIQYYFENRPLATVEETAKRFGIAYSSFATRLRRRYPNYRAENWTTDQKWKALNEWLEKYPEIPLIKLAPRANLSLPKLMEGIKQGRLKHRLDRIDDEYIEHEFGINAASKAKYKNIIKTAYFMRTEGDFDFKEAAKRRKKQQIENAIKAFHTDYPRKSIRTIAAEFGLDSAEFFSILRKKKLDPRSWSSKKKIEMVNQWAHDYPDMPLCLLANRAYIFKQRLIVLIRSGKITERLSDNPQTIIKELGDYALQDRTVIKTVANAYLRLQKRQNLTISHA